MSIKAHFNASRVALQEECEGGDERPGEEAGPQGLHLRHVTQQTHHVAQQVGVLRELLLIPITRDTQRHALYTLTHYS